VIARQLARRKARGAVHAEIRVAAEQRLVVQRRHVIVAGVARIAGVPNGGDDGVDFEHRAPSGARVGAAVQLIEKRTARVSDLLLMVQSCCFLVVDPLERHARDVGAQHQLRQPARGRHRDDVQILREAVIRLLEIYPSHGAV